MIKAEALSAEAYVLVVVVVVGFVVVLDVAEMEEDSFGSSDGLGLFLFGLA
jgi:hypothetical protein